MIKTLVVVVGATGVGKTDCTIRLAKKLHAEVINADSRQLYASMRIGTAAPAPEQLAEVRHHFVGCLASPTDYYSAAQYESDVMNLLNTLDSEYAILSGGSMMYVDAACNGIDDIPTISDEVRQTMRQRLETEGLENLAAELHLLDPEYYAICDARNPKRVVHALEICYQSGTTYSSLRSRTRRLAEGTTAVRPFNIIKIGLERERDELYARINARVDEMMRLGLLDEVRSLLPYRHCNSLNTVGYKELFAYLDGEMSLYEAVEKIKRNTRVYSRKQMTWFKKDPHTVWLHPDNIRPFMIDDLKDLKDF